ncbi:MAG: hypothetical protein QXT01_03520, partial [Sulfolobales archaeon]
PVVTYGSPLHGSWNPEGTVNHIRVSGFIKLHGPRGTSSSQEHCFVMEKHGLDRHTASAYLIALKHL